MTVIEGIESEELKSRSSEATAAIMFNDKVEDKLHVIMVISNPCGYERRWLLAKEFAKRLLVTADVILYTVELVYGEEPFRVTEQDDPHHLQMRTQAAPLWVKESLINAGVKHLVSKLCPDWRAMAWIDADVEFENLEWAAQTLKILNGSKDIVQLFSHCADMDREEGTMRTFKGFGFLHDIGRKYTSTGPCLFHPGYAWAVTRKAYERMGGVFEYSILGSGDHNMAMALLGTSTSINGNAHENYKRKITGLVARVQDLRLGYTPGVIRHYFHGSKDNRQYNDRWKILIKFQYDPDVHVRKDAMGVIEPSAECPSELTDAILEYFHHRKEDD